MSPSDADDWYLYLPSYATLKTLLCNGLLIGFGIHTLSEARRIHQANRVLRISTSLRYRRLLLRLSCRVCSTVCLEIQEMWKRLLVGFPLKNKWTWHFIVIRLCIWSVRLIHGSSTASIKSTASWQQPSCLQNIVGWRIRYSISLDSHKIPWANCQLWIPFTSQTKNWFPAIPRQPFSHLNL